MNGPFTAAELVIIQEMNDADLGEVVEKLSPIELIRLKTGEGISLKMIIKGKALLEIYKNKSQQSNNSYVTRAEFMALQEEHTNLVVKTMLIFMALERRNLITEAELEEIAAELRNSPEGGLSDVRETSNPTSTRKRGRKRKEA